MRALERQRRLAPSAIPDQSCPDSVISNDRQKQSPMFRVLAVPPHSGPGTISPVLPSRADADEYIKAEKDKEIAVYGRVLFHYYVQSVDAMGKPIDKVTL